MNQKNDQGLNYIVQAINNIVEPKVKTLKYDKTYRAKVTTIVDDTTYKVEISGDEYQLNYKGILDVGDIVMVKAPLNNFSDIYIETEPARNEIAISMEEPTDRAVLLWIDTTPDEEDETGTK